MVMMVNKFDIFI